MGAHHAQTTTIRQASIRLGKARNVHRNRTNHPWIRKPPAGHPGVSWTYAFKAGSNAAGLWQIINGNQVALADEASLDYEDTSSYPNEFIEATSDEMTPTVIERAFTFSVTNVIEAPVNVTPPAVTGSVEVGSTLSCSTGTWTDMGAGSFAYQWKDASDDSNIDGATASTLVLEREHVGLELYCTVTATNSADSASDDSNTVGPVPDIVPAAFEVGDWSIAAGDEEADVTVSSLPDDGGDTITDIEYRLDGGSWVSSGGTSSFTISGLTNDVEYDVELRAVNSVGAGAASDVKSVTPEAAGGWTPLSPSTQAVVWLDPSDPSTMWKERTGSPPSTPAVVDDVVGTMLNKGTAGGYHRSASDASRPILRQSGALYYLEFDGGDDRLISDSNVTVGANATMALAVRFTSTPNYAVLGGMSTTSGNGLSGPGGFLIAGGGTGSNISVWANASEALQISSSTGTDYVFMAKKNGTALSHARNNGTPVTSTITDYSIGASLFRLGQANNGVVMSGRIYQAVLAAADWTSTDLSSLWTFMGSKSGLSL